MVSVGQGRCSGRVGGMVATVQGLGKLGWEEWRMDRWIGRRGEESRRWNGYNWKNVSKGQEVEELRCMDEEMTRNQNDDKKRGEREKTED